MAVFVTNQGCTKVEMDLAEYDNLKKCEEFARMFRDSGFDFVREPERQLVSLEPLDK